MSTISDDTDNIHNYIEEKKRYEHDENWEIVYIFESRFISKNMRVYGTRLQSLEKKLDELKSQQVVPAKMGSFLKYYMPQKKFDSEVRAVKIMHPATKNGFITGSIYLDDEYAKNFTKENPQQFIDHFKNLISNKDMIGDKTLIILSKEPHHLFKQTIEQSRKKSLDVAAKKKGQKLLSNYFQSVKKANSEKEQTKPKATSSNSNDSEFYVEKITRQLRGDLVKILWIPKDHYEVDPNYYISVFLLNELANELATAEGDRTLKDVVQEGIDLFPSEMWGRVFEITTHFEDAHFEDDESDEPDEVEVSENDE